MLLPVGFDGVPKGPAEADRKGGQKILDMGTGNDEMHGVVPKEAFAPAEEREHATEDHDAVGRGVGGYISLGEHDKQSCAPKDPTLTADCDHMIQGNSRSQPVFRVRRLAIGLVCDEQRKWLEHPVQRLAAGCRMRKRQGRRQYRSSSRYETRPLLLGDEMRWWSLASAISRRYDREYSCRLQSKRQSMEAVEAVQAAERDERDAVDGSSKQEGRCQTGQLGRRVGGTRAQVLKYPQSRAERRPLLAQEYRIPGPQSTSETAKATSKAGSALSHIRVWEGLRHDITLARCCRRRRRKFSGDKGGGSSSKLTSEYDSGSSRPRDQGFLDDVEVS
ncbi:hypothetical protein Q7P37_001825 [Cladosporium fusiforme]